MIYNFKKFLENNNNKIVEGTLPFFPGFYETEFSDFEKIEFDLIEIYNNENKTNYTYDDFDWDYDNVLKEVANLCYDAIKPQLMKLSFILDMKFVDVYSPKYYNYSTDQINIDYTIDYNKMKKYFLGDSTLEDIENRDFDDNFDYMYDYIDECIKSEYTSRPGFTSYYSNDIIEWLKDLLNEDLSDTQITSLIEYATIYEYENNIDGDNDNDNDYIYNSESLFNSIVEDFNTLIPEMKKN